MNYQDLLALCASGKADICDDSRLVMPGDIFVAMQGSQEDGAKYIEDALKRGAAWIVGRELDRDGDNEASFICHESPARALAELCETRWPVAERMKKVAITGTNGKTTSAWLLEHLFQSMGISTGLLGTVLYRWPGSSVEAPLTTPGLVQLRKMIARMSDDQVSMLVMELSSHALSQDRTGNLDFDGALFTNLTQDHLDYHKDLENYFRAKARLFLELPKKEKALAINSDDAAGRRLLELLPDAVAYGLHENFLSNRFLHGNILRSGPEGLLLEMNYGGMSWKLRSKLVGEYNAMNLLGVQALALQMGAAPEDLAHLESFEGVSGRLEKIGNPKGLHIFVDYAHTPDALENVLKALRKAGFERLITVFGCGGNRDRGKRPLMGKAVAQFCDVAILTSDNPRMEDPMAIIADVLPGLEHARESLIEADRRKATELAINMLGKNDALLIAGKGHENYQIIGREKHHYSDQEVVREILGCA